MNGGRQICFTDSKGKALFSIPDGGIIRLFYGNGEDGFALCRYLDETHARIDGVDYLIRDLHREWSETESAMPPHKNRK